VVRRVLLSLGLALFAFNRGFVGKIRSVAFGAHPETSDCGIHSAPLT
jgi:hypothetical protein